MYDHYKRYSTYFGDSIISIKDLPLPTELNNLDIVQRYNCDLLILSAINKCHVQDCTIVNQVSMAFSCTRVHKNGQGRVRVCNYKI